MSLRLRLFLLLAVLVLALVGTQALLVRSLAGRLHSDVRTVAFRVGEEILSGFEFRTDETLPGSPDAAKVFVFAGPGRPGETPPHATRESAEGEGAQDVSAAGEPEAGKRRFVLRREVTLREETPEGARFERRIDLDPPGAGRPHLEPGHEADVLFLHGTAAAARTIPIPRAEIAGTLTRFRSELLGGALALALAGILAAALVADRATRPLKALASAARRVGEGELGIEVPARTAAGDEAGDEVAVAVASFNRMSRRLAELDRENRRLAESERLSELGEVARGLAHTLRNPLNALGLSIEELAARAAGGGGAETGASAALAEGARRQIERIDATLRSFLALASADATASEGIDLATVAREVALEALQDGGGRVRLEVDAPAPVVLAAVAAELKAALQALVVNAVEASPPGGRVAVRVREAAAGRAVVEVDDEGAGIPAEVAARLFQPHVTTKPHGSGMGLFLAYRIATGRYGGEMTIARRPQGGTRARLELCDRLPSGRSSSA